MKIWKIISELEQIYTSHSTYRLPGIADDTFVYVSDFENIAPLNLRQYKEYLTNQLENFYYPNSLEILEERYNRKMIELVLQKDSSTLDHYIHEKKLNFHPFLEPRLLHCDVKDGKICRMHLCRPQDRKIPDGIQDVLLESCRKNNFEAARKAIEDGAYAGSYEALQCMYCAAESGGVELCRLLLEDEADIISTGWDTVFCSIRNPDVAVLNCLLQANAPLDVVLSDLDDNAQPMTPLDYAIYLHNQAAECILRERNAPTFEDLKKWCFEDASFKIRLSGKRMDGGDMSIGAVGEEIDEPTGFHIGRTGKMIWMDDYDCWYFIIPFFLKYFKTDFEPNLEDNLISLADAGKALLEIRDFIAKLRENFDDPQVREILSKVNPTHYIVWKERSSGCSFYFTKEDKKNLWKIHRQELVSFYQEFCVEMEKIIAKAKQCGDGYISFVGP